MVAYRIENVSMYVHNEKNASLIRNQGGKNK